MISDADYKLISSLVEKYVGIDLGAESQYLVDARMTSLARELGYSSTEGLLTKIRNEPQNEFCRSDLICSVLDAMTTNESLFFRDERPFEALKKHIFPQLYKSNSQTKKIRIWSAACSTGQEPFSIAMTIDKEPELANGWQYEIVATDVCKKVLERANTGCFTALEIQRGLPPTVLNEYFTEQKNGFQIKDHIKKMVQFKHMNLLDSTAYNSIFDIIFCRNVLIYFKPDLKRQVFNNLARCLNVDGLLVLGGAESTTGFTDRFARVNYDDGMLFKKVK